jgi:hypothetical protein
MRPQIATAVENAQDYDRVVSDLKCNHCAAFEAGNSQAHTEIVAPDAAVRKH